MNPFKSSPGKKGKGSPKSNKSPVKKSTKSPKKRKRHSTSTDEKGGPVRDNSKQRKLTTMDKFPISAEKPETDIIPTDEQKSPQSGGTEVSKEESIMSSSITAIMNKLQEMCENDNRLETMTKTLDQKLNSIQQKLESTEKKVENTEKKMDKKLDKIQQKLIEAEKR